MKQPESCIVECERACAARRLCVNTVYAPRVPQFVAPSFAANHQKARGDCWYRPKFQVPGPGSASEAIHMRLPHRGRLRCFAVRSGRPSLHPPIGRKGPAPWEGSAGRKRAPCGRLCSLLLFKVVTTGNQFDINVDKLPPKYGALRPLHRL